MEKLPGIISVGLLVIIVAWLFFFIRTTTRRYGDFVLLCSLLLLYETVMWIASSLQVNNHLIANVNTLVYAGASLFVLGQVYKRYHSDKKSINILLAMIGLLITVGWFGDNFLPGHSINRYNSIIPAIVSGVMVLIGVYLMNVLIFAKSDHMLSDPDVLIIAGMLMRSITFGFTLWFLKFDYGFDWNTLSNLLTGINVGLCISDMIFLLAVYRITINHKEVVEMRK